ncbi:hypothetical protein MHYP_G00033430 [Metynnis hypsauchen]
MGSVGVQEREGSQERKERGELPVWDNKAPVAPQDPQVLQERAGPEAKALQASLELRALQDALEPPAAPDPLDPLAIATRIPV